MKLRFVPVALVAGSLALVLGGGVAHSAPIPMGNASAETISRMSGSTTYRASQGTLWSWSESASWLCSLIPACTGATRRAGQSGETIEMQISLEGSGLPLPAGLSTVPVSVQVTNRVAGQSLDLEISVDNALGDFSSKARLSIDQVGLSDARTRLTYKTLSASGSGVTGATVTKELAQSVQAQLDRSAADYYQYVSLDPVTTITVKALKSKSKTRKTPVVITAATTFPEGFTPPTASGTVRVYAGGKLACATAMAASRAVCSIAIPSGRTTKVMAVLNGRLSSGTTLVTGGTGYIKNGVRR